MARCFVGWPWYHLPAASCLALLWLIAGPATAQVTVNPQALDPLAPPPADTKPLKHPAPHPPTRSAPPPPHSASPPRVPPPRPAPLVVPPVPPPPPVLQPLVPPPPPHPTELPPPAPIVANAMGTVLPIPGGVRVTFGADSADLNAATNDALRALARRTPAGVFTITAFAKGQADDPSTPRRLSLSRALAARSLLMAEGIPSTRILVRALGPNVADEPADRVDVTVAMPPSAHP